VIVPVLKGNAKEGQTATVTRLAGKHAVVYARPKAITAGSPTNAAVLQFAHTSGDGGGWYDAGGFPKTRKYWVGGYRDQQAVTVTMAYLFTDAVA